jgi:hypothetical protein
VDECSTLSRPRCAGSQFDPYLVDVFEHEVFPRLPAPDRPPPVADEQVAVSA